MLPTAASGEVRSGWLACGVLYLQHRKWVFNLGLGLGVSRRIVGATLLRV